MTEWTNRFDSIAEKKIGQAYFGWLAWANEMNGRLKKKKTKKKVRKNDRSN
ncbi:hypothetical protein HTVC033P_gp03 [Pelagibacter phage HTVC033P]|nr:hypothetical protein HTVC033P_gp03 [Pelagibacter phage HTVC033P]